MEEIKVGDYIRTIDGYIRRIAKVNTESKAITYSGTYILDKPYKNSRSVARNKIIKFSSNIIDLIEKDDVGIMNCYGLLVKKFITESDILELKLGNYELLKVVTKEQFADNEYRLED